MDISSQPKPSFAAIVKIVKQLSVNDEVISPMLGQRSAPADISPQAPVHRHAEQKEVLKKDDAAWNVVTKKRKQAKQPSIGTGKKATTIIKTVTAVKSPAKILLSRLHADTTLEQVKVFVEQQFNTNAVDVLQLSAVFPESYSSFRISISDVDLKDALNVNYWTVN